VTVIVYAVVVIAVLIYTTIAANKLIELSSRDAIAEMIGAELKSALPAKRAELMARLNDNADDLAIELVGYLKESVPALENHVQVLLDDYTDTLVGQLKGELVPSFAGFIKESASEINLKFKELTDEEISQGVVELVIDDIEVELDKFMNDSLVSTMEGLQKQLVKYASPNAKLTRSEDAQRKALMYWAYLSETTEIGESPLKQIFGEINSRYRLFSGEDKDQLHAPLVDDDVEGAIKPGTE